MASPKQKKGFTLIELLLAASISTIIIFSIYSAFQSGILSYRKVDAAFETYQKARIILSRIEADLKNAFLYNDKAEKFWFKGEANALEFFSLVDNFRDVASVRDFCRLQYKFSENTLKRACYKNEDALNPGLKEEEVLAEDVQELSFKYIYKKEDSEEFEEFPTWPATIDGAVQEGQKEELPLAVKIKLILTQDIEFNQTVPLPLGGK